MYKYDQGLPQSTHIPLVAIFLVGLTTVGWAQVNGRSHLPDSVRSMEIWDRRGNGPIVEWRANSHPSPSPLPPGKSIYSRLCHSKRLMTFHEWIYLRIRPSAVGWTDEIQFDSMSALLSHEHSLQWKCTSYSASQSKPFFPPTKIQFNSDDQKTHDLSWRENSFIVSHWTLLGLK